MDVETRYRGAAWRWPLLFSVVLLNVCITYLLIGFKVLIVTLQIGKIDYYIYYKCLYFLSYSN